MKNQILPYKASRIFTFASARIAALIGLLLAIHILSTPLHAQNFAWALKTPNTFHKSAVVSGNGATFTLGAFSGTVTVGGKSYKSAGGTDLLLVKYLDYGTVSWAIRIGGTGDEQPGDLAYSDDLGLYITGSFRSIAKLTNKDGSTAAQLSSLGNSDIFVAKYDWYGKFYWARKAGGGGEDFGNGIHVDKSSNVYLTGSFTNAAIFSSGFAGMDISATLTSLGNSDIFVAKYDKYGTFKLAAKTGGKGYDFGKAITTNPGNGDIYVTGGYSPATSLYTTNIVLAKFWSSGTIAWAKVMGMDTYVDQGNDLTATKDGVYLTGYFGGMATFDAITLSSSGPADAFLAFYNHNSGGHVSWAKRFGGSGWDEGQSLAQHEQGIYLAGVFSGTATFGSQSITALGGAADKDLFLSSFSNSGTPVWTRRMGTTGQDLGNGGMAVSNVERASILFTGNYAASLTLGSSTLTGPGTLLTRIDMPGLREFELVLADKDSYSEYGYSLSENSSNTIDYRNIYTYNINIEVTPTFTYKPGPVGSVKFILDGVERIDNTFPYTWAGDEPKVNGGFDYKGFTPSEGAHKLVAIPYSGSNGTGVKGISKIIQFTIINTPKISNLILINAEADKEIKAIAKETSTNINYKEIGSQLINIRADHDFVKVGSMKFVLNGEVRIENAAPFTWAGDAPKAGGGTDYKGFTLAPGYYDLIVTPYSQADGKGTAGSSYKATLYVSPDSYRIAAPDAEPGAQQASFTVAPNPFSHTANLSFTAAESGPATVEIYSMQGMLIERLYKGNVESGKSYKWEFNAKQLPSGFYMGRIQAGGQLIQQKMILSR